MRELTADLFLSLDGCAGARGYGAYFGYGGPELDAWVRHNFHPGYEILMGRVTYEALAAHGSGENEVSRFMRAAPKAVPRLGQTPVGRGVTPRRPSPR
ncbi:MAG: hypothetical protein P8Z81_16300 [Deinococcales bacterium]